MGGVAGMLLVLAFSGAFYPIDIPGYVAAYYEQNFGWLGLTP